MKIIKEQEVLSKLFKVYGDYENPLFLAKDVAQWIDYSKTSKGVYDVSKMLNTVDGDEKLIRTIFVSGQNREMWFLTEDGLYEVLMQSRKPIAKQFKKEVKKILKEIRKNGFYITDEKLEEFLENPQNVELALRKIKKQRIKQLKNSTEYISNELRVKFNEILLNLEDVRNGSLYGGTLYKQIYKKLNSDYGINLSKRKEDDNSLLSYVKENEFECLLYSLLDCYIRNKSNFLEIKWLAEKNKMNDDFGIFTIFEEYMM